MRRLTAACVLGLGVLVVAAPAEAARSDALSRALAAGRLSEASYALQRARSLFALEKVREDFGRVAAPSPRDATVILRDLAASVGNLRGTERAEARALLARPGSSHTDCDDARFLCFHWVTGGSRHASSPADVEATKDTFAAVWDLEVATYGYRAPLPDGTAGGNDATDIYLRDLGGNDIPLFGYCTTDDPNASSSPYTDVWAYCVVDNDFSQSQFGNSQTPQDFRDVTAAHEFFHAVQFAYDWLEDLWLMEGTAMLMEGQFNPGVDDRVLYLANSVLASPRTPVDRGADGFEYGAWIYWRFLVEELGELADPLIIRQIWERSAGASTDTDGPGPDTDSNNPYSLLATRRVLTGRGESFKPLFAKFASVNRVPSTFYDEGASYPRAPAVSLRAMSEGESTGWRSTELRHLADVYYAFRPSAAAGTDSTLRVSVNLPRLDYGPRASVVVVFDNGNVDIREITLDWAGRGAKTVPFGRETVRRIDLALTNASIRMDCREGTPYSCAGVGLDDLRTYHYRVVAR